ncbi:MAG TPA: transcription antitermination factor NusB [Bacteroidia bacterium]|nr:transcription antitermination factor NusB [Bacteroidia bacterium]
MQTLYSYFQQEKPDAVFYEKELFKSLDKIYDLYIYVLVLFTDIHHTALLVTEENKNKRLPSKEDLQPNMRFIENVVLVSLTRSEELKKEVANRKISWQSDFDLVRKLYAELRTTELYKNYMASTTPSAKEDKQFLISMATEFLYEHDLLNHIFEEKNIHWADDTFGAFSMVSRTFENFTGKLNLVPLYKDKEDDVQFISTLFRKTIAGDKEFNKLIDEKTKNWELDRIASMDILLMKMAIAEFLYVSNVPVKVSLNEYIDISKEYSTPNSRTFINGVLDKIIADLKRDNKIQKTGRGLMEGN